MAQFHCFLEDETGLGHAAFKRIDQQQDTVYHLEDTFDLTAEVSMAGGVDNVDFGAFIMERGVFRGDGDASFTFQIA